MNFMDIKRLMIITGKTALEILEVVNHAEQQLKRQNESNRKQFVRESTEHTVRDNGHTESETDIQNSE